MKYITLSIAVLLFTLLTSNAYASEKEIDFDYSGKKGPERWDTLSKEFALCGKGKMQSPIDIPDREFYRKSDPVIPHFKDAHDMEIMNTGNTVEIGPANDYEKLPAKIDIKGKKYQMKQMHFHSPSEHRVDGKYYDVESHMVFERKDDKNQTIIAVIATFFIVGKDENAFLSDVVKNLPMKKGYKNKIDKLELEHYLCGVDDLKDTYNYKGSLTTPPCSEGVKWYINRKIQPLDVYQYNALRHTIGYNARPVQQRYNAYEYGRRGKF